MTRKSRLLVLTGLTTMIAASGVTAGGVLCMLAGRDVTIGEAKSIVRDGKAVPVAAGVKAAAIGPKTEIIRIERIRVDQIRPDDTFVARNPKKAGEAAPAVVVFQSPNDVLSLYTAMGHGTERPTAVKAAAK